jgi:hypothetical protein
MLLLILLPMLSSVWLLDLAAYAITLLRQQILVPLVHLSGSHILPLVL